MGKRNMGDESQVMQGGCMWGLAHVLGYHQWPFNVRKMIHHHRYEAGTHDKCNPYEKLLDEQESGVHGAKSKRSGATKKRSLRARVKAIYSQETAREGKDAAGFSTKSSLQRTYSIHHLQSADDFFGKIRTDWISPIIFFPTNSEDCSSQSSADNLNASPKEKPDVFEIFKVDKDLLLKHLRDSDESVANFSRTAFGFNAKGKFSKSRSFPVPDSAHRRKLKPLKLESKQKEVWSFPSDHKVHAAHQSPGLDGDEGMINKQYRQRNGHESQPSESLDDGIRKHTHRRSHSLNESLDKYARLFENSFRKDVKLSSSQSLRLTSEYGYAPLYSKRKRSLSHADSYYSDVNLEVLGENSQVIAEDREEEDVATSDTETVSLNENMEIIKDDDASEELQESDTLKEAQDQRFLSDSDIFWQDSESSAVELHVPKGKEHESRIDHKLDSSVDTDDLQSLRGKPLWSSETNLENYETNEEMRYPQKKNPDLDYVRHLLDKSGIAIDAFEMPWHASDQLLGPQLFEEAEAGWHHEEGELDGRPDFQGCWHHQMLFDLVNEVLLDVYDISLPYYPKALSSTCHVRAFPMGDRVIQEVCTSIGTLMNIEPQEKQTLDCIVARDLARDRRWMNLQLESESVAIYLEDMIFDELLQEVIFS